LSKFEQVMAAPYTTYPLGANARWQRPARKSAAKSPRAAMFLIGNLLFVIVLAVIDVASGRNGHDPFLYLMVLFAICTLPLLFVRETHGRFSLLVVSCPILFVFYGVNDVLTYFMDIESYWRAPDDGLFTGGEVAVLLGLSLWMAGYVLAANASHKTQARYLVRDWKTRSLVWVGLVCIALGIWATWGFQLSSPESRNSQMGRTVMPLIVLGRMLEPVGVVLLSYAYLKTQSRTLLMLVLGVAAMKLPLGIILNSKEIGISFLAIFMVTKWLYDGAVPRRWLAIAAMVVVFYFPLAYAYRATIGARHLDVAHSMHNLPSLMDKALSLNEKSAGVSSGMRSFAARVDLKSLMELIVARTGKGVPFQEGHTFAELPYVFIPRFIADKPSVSAGQLFNREFHISADPNTYISTSFLGELYWNFSWFGMASGMFAVGLTWGLIGGKANMAQRKSVTRLLILVSAIYLFAIRFETGIAQQYIVFIRSVAMIFLLHLVFRTRSGEQPSIRSSVSRVRAFI